MLLHNREKFVLPDTAAVAHDAPSCRLIGVSLRRFDCVPHSLIQKYTIDLYVSTNTFSFIHSYVYRSGCRIRGSHGFFRIAHRLRESMHFFGLVRPTGGLRPHMQSVLTECASMNFYDALHTIQDKHSTDGANGKSSAAPERRRHDSGSSRSSRGSRDGLYYVITD
jgi:hypothetical protein